MNHHFCTFCTELTNNECHADGPGYIPELIKEIHVYLFRLLIESNQRGSGLFATGGHLERESEWQLAKDTQGIFIYCTTEVFLKNFY